jgi:hypothetical protein
MARTPYFGDDGPFRNMGSPLGSLISAIISSSAGEHSCSVKGFVLRKIVIFHPLQELRRDRTANALSVLVEHKRTWGITIYDLLRPLVQDGPVCIVLLPKHDQDVRNIFLSKPVRRFRKCLLKSWNGGLTEKGIKVALPGFQDQILQLVLGCFLIRNGPLISGLAQSQLSEGYNVSRQDGIKRFNCDMTLNLKLQGFVMGSSDRTRSGTAQIGYRHKPRTPFLFDDLLVGF